MRFRIGLMTIVLGAATAHAQGVPENLQCYKVTNATLKKLRAVVDLDAPSLGVAPGCRLKAAKHYCVPAKKTVQPGTAYDGPTPVTGIPYNGPPAETDRICYTVDCPAPYGAPADQVVTDGFGRHEFRRLKTEMVCVPAIGGTLPPPANGFRLESPEVDIQPGQDVTYCWYFRTPNSVTVPVAKFTSEMRGVNDRVVMMTTLTHDTRVAADRLPPGTVSAVDCTLAPLDDVDTRWIYAADTPTAELAFPANDGAGNPVAMEIPPNSAGFLFMHHRNTTSQVQKGRVVINAEAVDGPIYTKTDTFTTDENDIAIPPMTTGYARSRACTLPANARFWHLTTHAQTFATRTSISDATSVLFDTTTPLHPGGRTFAAPFYTFGSGKLGYGCRFDNPHGFTVRRGSGYQTQEQCIAAGYYLPATRSYWCLDGFGPW